MTIRLGDVLNLPNAIQNELEYRSQLKAQALAHHIVNKVTGSNMQVNPSSFNPYLEEPNRFSMSLVKPNREND